VSGVSQSLLIPAYVADNGRFSCYGSLIPET
jgi:hypothetical protein